MIIVQDPHRAQSAVLLAELHSRLVESGLAALAVVGVVIVGMWWLVVRMFREPTHLPLAEIAGQAPAKKHCR